MANEHLVLCGHARLTSREEIWKSAPQQKLSLSAAKKDVHLHLRRFSRQLAITLPTVAVDLLEVASYVYAADQAITRGGKQEFEYGSRWCRHFRFEIPVRRPEVWQKDDVSTALAETLGFLSDDRYSFAFTKSQQPNPIEGYLFDTLEFDAAGIEEVILFSGGLDSLGGAVQEVLQGRRKVALVSHRPVDKIYARQQRLAAEISARVVEPRLRPLHIAVEVNKGKILGRDFMQRSRSFLFAALAAVVAQAFGLRRVRFYENGVISLNLPISPQVLGGRATRTTHPQVLKGFERFFSRLFDCPFEFENPFLWKTRAQVLTEIRTAGHGDLCALTSSCTRTLASTAMHTHCGRCAQCVDRRLSALAAGLDENQDPPEVYASDVLTGEREGADLTLIERYLGTARRIDEMTSLVQFVAEFAEASRVLRYVDAPPNSAAQRVFELHKRHARDVCAALAAAVCRESVELVRQRYRPNCMLLLALGADAKADSKVGSVTEGPRESPRGGPPVLYLDAARFEARLGDGKSCFLGNTMEYRLLERLNRRPGDYISVNQLRDDVWQNPSTEKNTVQRTVSNLRRKLESAGMSAIKIDGSQKDHYRLVRER
jgi:7-cyano-7-deazaguanine synthase in queuosine biosynthesis